MNIRIAKIIPDLRLFEAARVSRERGRKRLDELETEGAISPLRTPTGRKLLSIDEAERVIDSL